MTRTYRAALAALALLTAAAVAPALAAPARSAARAASPSPLVTSRGLLTRLEKNGRATASIEHVQPDPFGDGIRRQKGTLAVEPPDRTRLDFASGESVALRSDGGEWLQPSLGQMLRLTADHARTARQWWSLLLPGAATRFSEKALGGSRYLVIAKDSGSADSAWVTLGSDGLPRVLRFRGVDGEFVDVRFLSWAFAKPRGPKAFAIEPPAGTDVIEMP